MKRLLTAICLTLLFSCSPTEQSLTREEAIQQIKDVEQAFNDLLAKEGRAVAFAHFAAPDGGIFRNGKMIMGKDSIFAFYDRKTSVNVKLTWKPTHIDLADDFSMASTSGPFEYSGERANGETFASTGLFHTVWKRQQDGSWKYIYD